VQKPEKKPRMILVLKFTLQQCGKSIITDFIAFLQKNHSGIVNVNPINTTVAKYGITSRKLRVIGADHASRIHGGRNDSYHQYLRKLACRQIVGRVVSVEHYGIMNDSPVSKANPSCNCSKGSGDQAKKKEKMD
jgi:hypothetical protein